jgi:hypothetical protein
MERTEFDAVMRYVFERPCAFLFADTGSGDVYNNFERIAIRNNDIRHVHVIDDGGEGQRHQQQQQKQNGQEASGAQIASPSSSAMRTGGREPEHAGERGAARQR